MPLELPQEVSANIPPEVMSHASIQRYNDLPSLLKGHIEAESYRGRSVSMPDENAKPEDITKWKAEHLPKFSKVLDLPPSKADDYEFKFDGVENDTLKNDKLLGVFRTTAHQLGLSKSQAAGLANAFAKDILPQIAPAGPNIEFIEGKDNVDIVMKETFKSETPQRMDEYRRGVEMLSMSVPEIKDILNDGVAPFGKKFMALGDHPGMVKLITEIGRLTGQDFGGGVEHNKQAILDAQTEIEDIKNNKQNPWHERWKRGDKEAKAHMNELWAATTGGR